MRKKLEVTYENVMWHLRDVSELRGAPVDGVEYFERKIRYLIQQINVLKRGGGYVPGDMTRDETIRWMDEVLDYQRRCLASYVQYPTVRSTIITGRLAQFGGGIVYLETREEDETAFYLMYVSRDSVRLESSQLITKIGKHLPSLVSAAVHDGEATMHWVMLSVKLQPRVFRADPAFCERIADQIRDALTYC